jgi:hypothetical protein
MKGIEEEPNIVDEGEVGLRIADPSVSGTGRGA